MHLNTLLLGFGLLVIAKPAANRRFTEHYKLAFCHENACGSTRHFNCECEGDIWFNNPFDVGGNNPKTCIPERWVCDGKVDCKDASDEMDCSCTEDEVQCSFCERGKDCIGFVEHNLYQCIPKNLTKDNDVNCYSKKDIPTTSTCKIKELICDGNIDCPWLTPNDEGNCSSCPEYTSGRCACNKPGDMQCKGGGPVCYSEGDGFSDFDDSGRCNQYYDCADRSDETGCKCSEDQFTCQCYRNHPVTCEVPDFHEVKGCIPLSKYHDGVADCVDKSDETPFQNTIECGECNVKIYRFNNTNECNQIGFPACDNSTCYSVPAFTCASKDCKLKDVICTSHCSGNSTDQCNRAFQCDDGTLLLAFQFCDGKFDCTDKSDEFHNHDHAGFTCVESKGSCLLPQRNLYDDAPHCSDESDLCQTNDGSCFECFDKRSIISSKQVCDGSVDCYDLSDECLCQTTFNNPLCDKLYPVEKSTYAACPSIVHSNNTDIGITKTTFGNITSSSIIECRTKYDNIKATLCDGTPECRDFRDECLCPNPPRFCNDSCHYYYPMGDRYCDGIEDEAYIRINKSDCPKGFDELYCPNRFKCQAGNRVSINIDQVCDGKKDCDDYADERNCKGREGVFSSETEMIDNVGLRLCFWFIGFLVIAGNLYVLVTTTQYLRKTRVRKSLRYQFVIVLNIAGADFIMGFYLLTIASYSEYFSGYYGEVDHEWRSSIRCSVIGSLAVISSEASCFLMVLLTGFRLFKILFPINALTASTVRWKIGILVAWLLALIIALTPVGKTDAEFFTHEIWFSNRFTIKKTWDIDDVIRFACRLSQMTNMSLPANNDRWDASNQFLQTNFARYAPKGEFGYYGETSVCLPRFFVKQGETAWEYTLLIILINFLCFIVIAVSYFLIYLRSTRNPIDLKRNLSAKQEASMQRRIAVIIFTDSLCWIPVSIMAFVKLSGLHVSDQAYVVSAALLLPINSAFNPLLYSTLSDRLFDFFDNFRKSKKDFQLSGFSRKKTGA